MPKKITRKNIPLQTWFWKDDDELTDFEKEWKENYHQLSRFFTHTMAYDYTPKHFGKYPHLDAIRLFNWYEDQLRILINKGTSNA